MKLVKEDDEMLLWAMMLCVAREIYRRKIASWNTHTITLQEDGTRFIIDIILFGNYEEEVLEKVFSIPLTLQLEIRSAFLN